MFFLNNFYIDDRFKPFIECADRYRCADDSPLQHSQVHLLFGLVGFYGISTIENYVMQNALYTYISDIYDLVWFDAISTIAGYLIPNPVSTHTHTHTHTYIYIYIIYIYIYIYISKNEDTILSTKVDNNNSSV